MAYVYNEEAEKIKEKYSKPKKPVDKEKKVQTQRKFTIRIKDEESLERFSTRVGVECLNNTKSLILPSRNIRIKKSSKKTLKPPREWENE